MSTRVQDVRLRELEEAKRQAKIRSEGEAAMMAHTTANKNMRMAEAKKQIQPNQVSSQNMGGKIQAASSALSMMGAQGGPTDAGSGALSGAASGAQAGMAFGPKGAAIGGIVGAGMGILKAKQARKQARAKIEAEKEEALADIEERKADRINQALGNLQNAFSNTLL